MFVLAGKIKGITLEIGGDTTGLKKALSNVKRETNDIQVELKQVERLLKLDPKNTELLEQKQKLLNDAIKTTQDKLTALKKAKEKADKEMEDGTQINEQQYRLLQREIIQTEHDLKNLTKEVEDFSDTGRDISDVGDKISGIGKKGMAVTTAITGIAAGMVAAAEETREFREDMNRLETAFETSGKSANEARNIYNSFYGILGESDRAVEASNHLAKLCNNQEELSKWTDICAGVSATFGDSLPIEGLTEAANETAKVGAVTGVLANALKWVGLSEDQFNEQLKKCSSEQERSALITNTLSSAYKDAAIEFKTANADIIANREATQKLNEELAELSEMVEPIITSVKEVMAGLLEKFNELSAEQKNMVATIALITAAVPPLLIVTGQTITSIIQLKTAYSAAIAEGGMLAKMFNTTSLAGKSLFGMIGAGTATLTLATAAVYAAQYAYVNYKLKNDEAAQSIIKLKEESSNLLAKTGELINSTNEATQGIKTQESVIYGLIDRLYELESQNDKSNEEQLEMQGIIERLNSEIPNLNLAINSETGALNLQRGEVDALAQSYINLAYAKAYASKVQTAVEQRIENQEKIEEIEESLEKNPVKEPTKNQTNTWKKRANGIIPQDDAGAEKFVKKYYTAIDGRQAQIDALEKANAELDKQISKWSEEAAKYSDDGDGKTNGNKGNGFNSAANSATKAAKAATKAVKTVTEVREEEFKKQEKQLRRWLEIEEISQEEYYNEVSNLRDEYLEDGSDLWWDYTVQITKYHKEQFNKVKEEAIQTYETIADTAISKLNEIKNKQKDFSEGLILDSLYTSISLNLGGEMVEGGKLKDWEAENNYLYNYKQKLEGVSERLKSLFGDNTDNYYSMLELLREDPYGEGNKILSLMTNADDETLKRFVTGWQTYQELAAETAEQSYKDEVEHIQSGFVDELTAALGTLPDEFKNTGETAAEFFGKGFMGKISSVLSNIKQTMGIDLDALSVGDFKSKLNSVAYYTEINQTITATPQTAYETAEQNRRVMENLNNQAVLA